MPTSLPLELWFAIFDNLDVDRDKTTLFACARSCKTLVAPSYHRIYHQVNLASLNNAQLLSFTKMIQSPSPDPPGKYIRRLSISSTYIPIRHLNSLIPALAQNLPGVISLHLHCPDWRTLSQHAKSSLKSGFQTAKRLELSAIHFASGDEMLELIGSFPALTSLGPVSFGLRHDTYTYALVSRLISLPNHLEALDISSHCLNIFDRLLRLNHPPNLRTLRISILKGAHRVPEFGSLLGLLGPNLESLTLYGSVDKMWADVPPESIDDLLAGRIISLSNTPNLRSITIHSGIFSSGFPYIAHPNRTPSTSLTLALLSQIPSPHLSEINLTIVVCYPSALDRLDWNRLDEILTRPLWRGSLARVVINVWLPRGEPLAPRDLDRVRLRLPLIAAIPGVSCMIESRPGDSEC